MFKITVKNGENISHVSANKGDNLYRLLAKHELIDNAPCGGKGTCGKCRVKITHNCPDVDDVEDKFFTDTEIDTGIRLACRINIEHDLSVEVISAFKHFGGIKILSEKAPTSDINFALDIGTTTLDGILIDAVTGTRLIRMTRMNPQKKYGADVFTRLNFSLESDEKRNTLKEIIVSDINLMLTSMLKRLDCDLDSVKKIAVSANTTMIHMLLGREVSKLAFAPFVTDFLAPPDMPAKEIGIICEKATLMISAA